MHELGKYLVPWHEYNTGLLFSIHINKHPVHDATMTSYADFAHVAYFQTKLIFFDKNSSRVSEFRQGVCLEEKEMMFLNTVRM